MIKKYLKTIMLTLMFVPFLKIGAQQINTLETIKPNSIILNGEFFNKYIEFRNQNMAKEYILIQYGDVINKIKEYSDDEYFDIDDIEFQKFILSLDIFETEHEKEFRNYIDIYENYEKNIQMDLCIINM